MRWEQIDFEQAVWTIPETKNGRSQQVALNVQAKEILERRFHDRQGEWVFPGKGGNDHLKEPKRAWATFMKRAGLEDFHIHDLRRTLATWLAEMGTNQAIVGNALNHSTAKATSIYTNPHLEVVRIQIQLATNDILKSAGKAQLAEVG